jgi:hypothetical protein
MLMEQEHEKNGQPSIGKSGGGWATKIHLLAQDAGRATAFRLSSGNGYDTPEGEDWLKGINCPFAGNPMIMARADEGDTTRPPALDLIFSGLDQRDLMFSAFGFLVLIVDSLR